MQCLYIIYNITHPTSHLPSAITMGSFSKPVVPIPPYTLAVLMYLAQQPSSSILFKERLVKAVRRLMRINFGPYMTPEQFTVIFTDELIESYVRNMGMDVVAFAHEIMRQEEDESLLGLGEYPITWTEAIAEGLRHMAWLMQSICMTRQEFDERYPHELFLLYTEFNGLDKLQCPSSPPPGFL